MDKRWEHVEGSVGEPEYSPDEDWPKPGEFLLFRIAVHYDGMIFHNTQLFDQDWLKYETDEGTEQAILTLMVEMLDERMDEHDKAHA